MSDFQAAYDRIQQVNDLRTQIEVIFSPFSPRAVYMPPADSFSVARMTTARGSAKPCATSRVDVVRMVRP